MLTRSRRPALPDPGFIVLTIPRGAKAPGFEPGDALLVRLGPTRAGDITVGRTFGRLVVGRRALHPIGAALLCWRKQVTS